MKIHKGCTTRMRSAIAVVERGVDLKALNVVHEENTEHGKTFDRFSDSYCAICDGWVMDMYGRCPECDTSLVK